jgi:hypothetical protein
MPLPLWNLLACIDTPGECQENQERAGGVHLMINYKDGMIGAQALKHQIVFGTPLNSEQSHHEASMPHYIASLHSTTTQLSDFNTTFIFVEICRNISLLLKYSSTLSLDCHTPSQTDKHGNITFRNGHSSSP